MYIVDITTITVHALFLMSNIINQGEKLNQWKSTSISDHNIENNL